MDNTPNITTADNANTGTAEITVDEVLRSSPDVSKEIVDMVTKSGHSSAHITPPSTPPPSAPTANELLAMVARLQKQVDQQADELAKAHQRQAKGISFKVSEKGALSVYGLNSRFPTTLYKNQWRKVFELADEILSFLEEHEADLKDPPKAGRPFADAKG